MIEIDVKNTIQKNIISMICMAVGIVLLIVGLSKSIPTSYIGSYGYTEYVGGDAYNIIIEAALRSGRISGAIISKSLYTCVGILITCMSGLKINLVKRSKEVIAEPAEEPVATK